MDHTISAIGVLVGLLTLIVVVMGGIFGFFGFRTFGSLRKDIETIKDIAGESEAKYKEAEETLSKIKPMVDNIVKVEKDVNGIKEKYENEFRDLSITEKPSGDTKEKLDELTKKSEFLEGVGVKLEPEDYFNLGLDLFYKEEYEKAKDAFGKAIKLKPDYADTWNNKGVALHDIGQPEEAVKSYDKAIKLKPDYADAWYNTACAYSLKGDKEKSLENLQKAIKLDSKYKGMSNLDDDFESLWDDEDFKKIVE